MSSEEIEVIKKKITDAGYKVPHITAEVSWRNLMKEGIITGPEMVEFIDNMISSAATEGK